MALSLVEQGNDTINERPDRVCVVGVSTACRELGQGVKVVMYI